jgi:hypothetical protein
MLSEEQRELLKQLKTKIKRDLDWAEKICKLCGTKFFVHKDWANTDSRCLCDYCKKERKSRYQAKGKQAKYHFGGVVSGGLPSLGKKK